MSWNGYDLILGLRTRVMGILNVTPDSFSDGGKFYATDAAVAQAQAMVEDGADIIDIGGESTRPFAEEVSAEDQVRRVVPVIEALAGRISIPISIDTAESHVAERALEAGAAMINDISALRADPSMAALAAAKNVPVILMHMLGNPRTMQISPTYQDVVTEIKQFLDDALQRAEQSGIPRSNIIVDPGIGFGKTVAHNYLLLKNLSDFDSLDVPVLVGPSRKAFIRKTLSSDPKAEPSPEHRSVAQGTQAVVAACAMQGAHILRVHDVAATRLTVKMIDAIRNVAD